MREHRSEFRDVQNRKQRETDAHDPLASKTERAAAIRDKGIRLADEVDLTRNLFVQSTGDFVNFTEEFGLRGAVEKRSRWVESVATRQKRPQKCAGDGDPTQKQQNHLHLHSLGVQQQKVR